MIPRSEPMNTRILVVEDPASGERQAAPALAGVERLEVGSVATAGEAVKRAAETDPDVILVALADAERAAACGREIQEGCGVPVVYLAEEGAMDRLTALGISDLFIAAPAHPRELRSAIALAASTRQLQRMRAASRETPESGALTAAESGAVAQAGARAAAGMSAPDRRIQSMLATTPAMIYATDLNGGVTFLSENVRTQLGYSPEELIGGPERWLSLVHPDEAPGVRRELQRAEERNTLEFEYRLRRADGQWRWVRSQFHVVRDPAGRAYELVGCAIDVTDSKQAGEELRQREAQLAEAQQVAHIGSWDWNLATHTVLWSDELYRIFGLKPQDSPASNDRFMSLLHPEDRERVHRTIQEALATQRPYTVEHRMVRPSGEVRVCLSSGRLMLDEHGRILRLFGTAQDVTEQKAAERALRESEERFRSLVTATSDIVWHADAQGRLVDAPSRWNVFTGLSEDAAKGDGWLQAVHPDDREETRKAWEDAVSFCTSYSRTYRVRRQDGEWRHFASRGVPVRESNGAVREWIGVASDITDQIRAVEALKESEERFRATFDQAPVGICEIDFDGMFKRVNRSMCEMFGYSEEEFVELRFSDMVHPDDTLTSLAFVQELIIGERTAFGIDKRYLRRNGETLWAHATVTLLRDAAGEPRSMMAVVEDITPRRAAEEQLRFRAHMLDIIAEAVIATDAAGTIIYLNRHAEQLFGWKASEALGRPVIEVTVPQISRRQAEEIMTSLTEGRAWSGEFLLGRRNGSTFPAFVSDIPVLDDQGRIAAIIGVSDDLTERKRAEAAQAQLAEIVQFSRDAIIRKDLNGVVTSWNAGAENLFGISAEEMLGRSILQMIPKERRQEEKEVLERNARGEAVERVETLRRRKDGSVFHASVTSSPIRDAAGRVVAISEVERDITERKKVEDKLHRSESQLRALTARMEKLHEEERTRIAREIHDELGQTLTGLKMDLRWLEHRLDELNDPRMHPLLDRVVSASELADATISAVQAIAADLRPGVLDKLGLPSALAYEARRFSERTGIGCEVRQPAQLPPLPGDVSTALFRIFQECLTNVARHADATQVGAELKVLGPDICLSVEDNGCGIKEMDFAKPNSLGVLGMQERAGALGGTILFHLGEAGGAVVTVRIPLGPDAGTNQTPPT